MNTTGLVMTVTDELLAELELCESCDCGFDMDRTDVKTVLSELRRLRAENAELAKDAGRYRWLRDKALGVEFNAPAIMMVDDCGKPVNGPAAWDSLKSGIPADEAIDTAMADQ